MKDTLQNQPPKWAQRLLHWYCKPSLLEDLDGDLMEYYHRNLKSKGVRKAKLIYILDVLKFFRLYTIRKPKVLNAFIQFFMIRSYITTSGRSIMRHKFFSAINIVGLSIGMSVALLIISVLTDMLSYDTFHEKGDRMYRILSHSRPIKPTPFNGEGYWATSPLKAGMTLHENVPGIESVTTFRNGFRADAMFGGSIVPVSGMWADESFFSVFTFPLLQGNSATALKEPYSLVVTEQAATKLFGTENAFGKTVLVKNPNDDGKTEYTITGIIKDVPKFSHLRFECLASLSTNHLQEGIVDSKSLNWGNLYRYYTYVVLNKTTRLEDFQATLDRISSVENKSSNELIINLSTQALKDIAISPDINNPVGVFMPEILLWVLGALTLIVLISACFNYTNLSIARSLKRSREIGIRKVIGAQRTHVFFQFLTESIVISLLALVFAFGLFLLLRPHFLTLAPQLAQLVTLQLSAKLILNFILLGIGVGTLAGFLPALSFTRVNPIMVLKNVASIRIFRRIKIRKALIVVQYTISLMFISATIIVLSQYKHFISFDVGFTPENVVNIDLQGNKAQLVARELEQMPEVKAISTCEIISGLHTFNIEKIKYGSTNDSATVDFNTVNESYLPLHEFELIAGRNFIARPDTAVESEVIINETFLRKINIANHNPQEALKESIVLDGKSLQIVGVVKDFHYGTAEKEIEAFMFRYSNKSANYLNVKVASSDIAGTLARLGQYWKNVDPVHPIEATLYTDSIIEAYNDFAAMAKIIGFLAFLAICISSLGLLGMVVFTTETRLKEISIRKVMGASEFKLIFILSKGFLVMLALAAVIGLPIIYIFFSEVVLSSFAYKAPISILNLLLGVLGVMGVAFILIGTQTIKVAKSNPSEVLKAE